MPNLYPALERQEVVVHAARHVRSLAELSDEELVLVAQAWRARATAGLADDFRSVFAFVNEGREAGASRPHSHSQLAFLPDEPPSTASERAGECRVCAAVERDLREPSRVVAERDGVVLACPYAPRSPFELLVAPAAHEPDAFAEDSGLETAFALLGDAVRRLHAVEGAVPLNAWLHTGAHWHLEVVPRLSVLAGLELGAGIYVSWLSPEDAARALREAKV